MEVIQLIQAMQDCAQQLRAQGKRIALVPTMGGLHEGHLSLIRQAREAADHVVVSIFVNPTQFGPGEDFATYPRDLERDQALCEGAGADTLFAPGVGEMYDRTHSVYVVDEEVGGHLEGESRPGHFRGVLTVVTKLFLAVQPHVAIFGRKDAQQLWLIRKLVRDLNLPVEILASPTVREADGLALSSRNVYLSPEHRQQATCLFRALQAAQRLFEAGERNVYTLRKAMLDIVQTEPDAEMDYIEIVDAARFAPVTTLLRPALALIAVRVGGTRLIDNMELSESVEPV